MVLPFAVWKSDGMNLAWFFCLLAHEVNLENWISNISYTKSCKWMNFFNLSLMIHVVQVNFRWLTLTFLSWVVFWCPCWNITTCVKNSLCQVYIIYIVFMQFILANIIFFLFDVVVSFTLQLCATTGSSLGYGFSRVMSMSKSKSYASDDESETVDGALAIWTSYIKWLP